MVGCSRRNAHLQTLTLLSASPDAPDDAPFPSRVERTATLPSLTCFLIFDIASYCGLALAHLVLPALTSLCVSTASYHPNGRDILEVLPHVACHAKRPHYIEPLQSVFIRSNTKCVQILAWALPDIDINTESSDMDINLPNEFTTPDNMHSVQVTFSTLNSDWSHEAHTEIFDLMMGGPSSRQPLDAYHTEALTTQ